MEIIRSAHNKTIQRIQKLIRSRSARRESGRIVLDGVHLVQECLEHGWVENVQIFVEDPITSEEVTALIQSAPDSVAITLAESHVFNKISTTKTTQGIVAVGRLKQHAEFTNEPQFALAIEGIQDPGNLGSILRSAAAFSVDTVFLSPGTADAYSPKCLRGGMGAQFRLSIYEDSDLSSVIDEFSGQTIGSSIVAEKDIDSVDFKGPVLLLVGSEGDGLSAALLKKADNVVAIPLANKVESLNVGSAVAILCFHKARLR
ncbi:MAG: RNA methyltransferase [Burkholderiales bacterium]|nr:RNA methyltransferase [Burkholderiales bacterium]OUT78572.1 MAG: hypothetical protein CBB82_03750 [Betaproteobacteria bacterium TMED22]|tara:strand:- start:9430 stop:10206 length:777 start_codon:yes stop_codon:yes gene_type:complete